MHNSHRVDSDGGEARVGGPMVREDAEPKLADGCLARGSGVIPRRSAVAARSRSGHIALVRPRELYATTDVIATANDALAAAGARVHLIADAPWQAAPALRRVIVELVNTPELARGISDDLVHPILKSFAPVRGDTDAKRAAKLDKYRRFWEAQETMMLALSIAIAQFQSRMYRHRRDHAEPRPAPGYTTEELRACVSSHASKIAIEGYLGTFFQALVARNLLDTCPAWRPAFEAACLLRDRLTATMTQISDEIETHGPALIAPGRSADLTSLLHAPQALEALPLEELAVLIRDGEDAITLESRETLLPISTRTWTFQLR